MESQESQAQGYPFRPLQDFVLGEVLGRTLERLGTPILETEAAILSHLSPGIREFQFTPNSKKQVLLQSMPSQFRSFLELGKELELLEVLHKTIAVEGRLDLALELIEWIFTGFEKEDLVRRLFTLVLNGKIELKPEFYSVLKEEYEKEMSGDLGKLRKENHD
ncbi:hypothetical protein [Leptospira inadai]|nr:hypothetical protein [Leptospira inadai]PNV77042.1 hypothetical protein BES34_000040 [Leptospira inadai serovar Lyme]